MVNDAGAVEIYERAVCFLAMGLANQVFLFQAEDGIRGSSVTGVQTCALPILLPPGATAVINADDEQAAKVIAAAAARALNVVTAGTQGRQLTPKSVERHG